MRQNLPNVLLFAVLAAAATGLYFYADANWFPKPEKPKPADPVAAPADAGKPNPDAVAAVAGAAGAAGGAVFPAPPEVKPAAEPPKADPPKPVTPAEPPTLIQLGGDNFYNRVLLSTRGGGVQQVVLPRFDEADRLGREVRAEGGQPVHLYLIPGRPTYRGPFLREPFDVPNLVPGKVENPARLNEPSYTIFHYPTDDAKFPDPSLGERNWKVVADSRPADGPQSVTFETELGAPHFVTIRKTYTLGEKDYHVGLRVEFEKRADPAAAKGKGAFRYQISGPRNLPIEGEWYTSTFRNALVGWTDKGGTARRAFEDASSVTLRRGSDATLRADNTFQYAGVSTQYFVSAVAIDDRAEGAAKDPWALVRATSELPWLPSPADLKAAEEEYRKDPKNPFAAARFRELKDLTERARPQFDDITVRAVSDPIDLAPGEKKVHAYALYNGPAKVRLLNLLSPKQGQVDPALVDWYMHGLGLQTVTDYQSPTFLGAFANAIYWSDLVMVFTNLMHYLLWFIHSVTRSWGLSIIVLTVMVRLLLFIPSRKQQAMNMKMMEVQKKLQPELQKLHEKYKDDFNAYNREKTRLMMQHGMNPFAAMGGCLLLFAQMPVFMGLYFCLQESIFFRLEPFLWVNNLAAPDMLVWWGEQIPMISSPSDMGGFLYLGPYLNILPLIAVGLMMWQQNKMMPPPTDEQQAMQQKMMKVMMVVVALMFYKVAAGLALYFIVSTGWGLIERQFIPKPSLKPDPVPDPAAKGGDVPAAKERTKGLLGRLRERLEERLEEVKRQADEQSARQIRNPNQIRNDPDRQDRRDKKKKRK